ncbi:Penicillin-binding protein 4* (PBP 4*) (PBP 4A) (Penicillin-binding protein E), partial [Durusdinium trenchii]
MIVSFFPEGLLAAVLCLFLLLSGCDTGTKHQDSPLQRFQAELDELHRDYDFPGATAAFVLADGTEGAVATGLADVESGVRMEPDARMLAASIGKTFVAATVLSLEREGTLSLDDKLAVWLSGEAWLERLDNHSTITVRHLLNHSSGMGNHVDDPRFARLFASNWSDAEFAPRPETLISYVLDQPSLFAPGQGWAYSDTGYLLLGLIIERATGRSYYEEVSGRFLTPLGLSLTSPSNRHVLPGIVPGYMAEDNAFALPRKTTNAEQRMLWNPAIEWTGGGLISNSLDLARWGTLLFEGQVMAGDYLDDLLLEMPVSADAPDLAYGAG